MVLVFSSACNESPHVRREVERAVHKRLALVPFRVEAVLPVKSLEYYISAQHWLDAFTLPREPHYAHLSQVVAAVLQPATGTASPPHGALTRQAPAALPGSFSDARLRLLQSLLAHHVGPVAGYLVRRAAKTAANDAALTESLAAEIELPAEQRAFIAASRE